MIRERTPDPVRAASLVQSASKEMEYLLSLPLIEGSTSTIVKGTYDCFRIIGQALMLARGKEAPAQGHHLATLQELILLNPSSTRPVQAILTLRDLRNKSEYDGYFPSIADAQEAIAISKSLFPTLLALVKKEIGR